MNEENETARVLLIADDPQVGSALRALSGWAA
jgi:hypothetical protein